LSSAETLPVRVSDFATEIIISVSSAESGPNRVSAASSAEPRRLWTKVRDHGAGVVSRVHGARNENGE
jgi:hypothetical protein